jgi:hypothetical protein
LPKVPRLPKIAEISRSPQIASQQLFNLDSLAITNTGNS